MSWFGSDSSDFWVRDGFETRSGPKTRKIWGLGLEPRKVPGQIVCFRIISVVLDKLNTFLILKWPPRLFIVLNRNISQNSFHLFYNIAKTTKSFQIKFFWNKQLKNNLKINLPTGTFIWILINLDDWINVMKKRVFFSRLFKCFLFRLKSSHVILTNSLNLFNRLKFYYFY